MGGARHPTAVYIVPLSEDVGGGGTGRGGVSYAEAVLTEWFRGVSWAFSTYRTHPVVSSHHELSLPEPLTMLIGKPYERTYTKITRNDDNDDNDDDDSDGNRKNESTATRHRKRHASAWLHPTVAEPPLSPTTKAALARTEHGFYARWGQT